MKGGERLFNKAAGYAVFKVTKAGLGVSGAGGGGVAVDKKTGARTYMRMGSAGAGLTIGASKYDIVILFETPQKFQEFAKGGWDSSATAQAAAATRRRGLVDVLRRRRVLPDRQQGLDGERRRFRHQVLGRDDINEK